MGIPSAVTIHGLWNDGIVRSILGQLYVGVLGRETLRRARRIIANSRFVASSLIRQFPWLQDKTSVVYPGATFTPESDVRAREKGMPIVLLTASQLNRSARRGVEVLLAAFAGYAVIQPDSKLVVVGGGMMARPRATSLRTNSGVISSGMWAPNELPTCCWRRSLRAIVASASCR